MVDISASYTNDRYHCPVLNEPVDTDIMIETHTLKRSGKANQTKEPLIYKHLVDCSGMARCGVKAYKKNSYFNWDICPLYEELNKEEE